MKRRLPRQTERKSSKLVRLRKPVELPVRAVTLDNLRIQRKINPGINTSAESGTDDSAFVVVPLAGVAAGEVPPDFTTPR
jgi:hypothetical protein